MKKTILSALLVVSVAGLAVPIVTAASRPPKLQYEMTTLANGLTVVLDEDHSTPVVNLQVWYHVGSKNEKPGRTGFAHLRTRPASTSPSRRPACSRS